MFSQFCCQGCGTGATNISQGFYHFFQGRDPTLAIHLGKSEHQSEMEWNKHYQAEGIKWTDNGPKLPKALYATRAISLSNSIYTMGGQTPDVTYSTNIFKLTCIGNH